MHPRGVATILCGIAIAGGAMLIFGRSTPPRATVLVGATPLTETFADVAAGARWNLQLELDQPHCVYVFTHNPLDGAACLFPSPQLRTELSNPLAPGTQTLPGMDKGTLVTWPGPLAVGPTDILVLMSREPIADVENTLNSMRQATNTVFPDGSEAMLTLPRGVTVDDLAPRVRWPAPILQAAATQPSVGAEARPLENHPGVWSWSWRVVVREAPAVQEQIQEAFHKLQQTPSGAPK